MSSTVDLILFGMEAGVRLGRKIIDVYQEEIRDRDIILPLAESPGAFTYEGALRFFDKEGKLFVQEGGLYHDLWERTGPRGDATLEVQDQLRKAAAYVDGVLKRAQKEGQVDKEVLYKGMAGYYAVAQWKKGDPAKPNTPLQRVAGTILEIGLDYVKIDPSFMDQDSKSQSIVRSILLALEPIDLAEQKVDTLLVDLFRSSMAVFYDNVDGIIEDDKLKLLLREIGETLKQQVEAIDDPTQLLTIQTLGRDILPGIVKASANVVLDNPNLFLADRDSPEKRLTAAVLMAVLEAARTRPDVFSGKTLVEIYRSALTAVGQNVSLLLHDGNREVFLASLFTSLATTLADHNPSRLYHLDLLREVIGLALETTGNNVHILVNPEKPEEQLLAAALRRVLLTFSDDFTENEDFSRIGSRLFSRKNLIQIIAVVFNEVSTNPEALLRKVEDDDARSTLAQIIGSVTAAITAKHASLLNGEGFTRLFEIAFEAFSKNPDRLIDLSRASPRTNIIYAVLIQVLESVRENRQRGGRDLLTGRWLLTALETALSSVSKNTDVFKRTEELVKKTLDRLLVLASDSHAGVLDAENLIVIFQVVLPVILKDSSFLKADHRFKDLVETTLNNRTLL
jgi:hypothetical protein